MDHELELIIPILELLGSPTFFIIQEILWKYCKSAFPISDMVEMWAAGGRLQGLGSGGLVCFSEHVPGIL